MDKNNKDLFEYERKIIEKTNNIINEYNYTDKDLFKEYKSLAFKYKKLLKQTEKMLKISDSSQKIIKITQNNIELLLDNSDQGFMTFGEDLLIDQEYSKECRKIFEEDISKKNVMDVLFKGYAQQEKNYTEGLNEIVKQTFEEIFKGNSKKSEVYITLLPFEVFVKNKLLKIKYKYLNEEKKIMCIITDISEKKALESELERERHNLKMAMNAILNKSLFKKYINDYKEYFNYEIYENINYDNYKKNIEDIYNEIHTFKGVFSQWFMDKTSLNLHNLEDKIIRFKNSYNDISKKEYLNFIININFNDCLEEDMNKLKKILGKSFFEDVDYIEIEKNNLIELKELIELYFINNEDKIKWIQYINKLLSKSMEEILELYKEYTINLAKKNGKIIDDFIIDKKNEILIDEEKYYDFNKSLIHIFKNIVYHGIELPEERVSKGKSQGGNVYCYLEKKDNNLILIIKDDGNGINLEKIKSKAIEKKLFSAEEMDNMNTEKIIDLIFYEEFSTEDYVDIISGRGVGMFSVKKEILGLNGEINVTSIKDKETVFKIVLPLHNKNQR